MQIDTLSISDLKSAWDFVKEDIKQMEKYYKEKNVDAEKQTAYSELKETESKLFHKLLNITRNLK